MSVGEWIMAGLGLPLIAIMAWNLWKIADILEGLNKIDKLEQDWRKRK